MQLVLPTLFHLLPLVPLAYGRVYGTVAILLLVILPYIKAKKLGLDIAHFEAKRSGLRDARLEREIEGLGKSWRRWRALTFLPQWEKWKARR